jgi:hypothetical protein
MRSCWLAPSAYTTLLGGLLLAGPILRAAPQAVMPADTPTVIAFDRTRPGGLPAGFRTLSSVDGEQGRWQVQRIDNTTAFGQVDKGRDGYRLAVLETPALANLRADVRLRLGPGDKAAGLAWRVSDAGNYYAARLDLKDREFGVYKFVRGNRIRLSRVSGLKLDDSGWHDLAVEHVGERLKVWLNGIPVATERDAALPGPGMIGLWMPGDSTAHFERLSYQSVTVE